MAVKRNNHDPKGGKPRLAVIGMVGVLAIAVLVTTGRASLPVFVELLALLIALVVILNLVARLITPPFGLPGRLPRKLSVLPRLGWYERPYLGLCRGWLWERRFAMGRTEDSVGVVGSPLSGKTRAILVIQALLWGGALISTSTKPDVLRATAARRRELARQHGGDVYVYAPAAEGDVEGFRPLRQSPLAECASPRVARHRVESLVNASHVGVGVENGPHWAEGAKRILRCYFLAASHHRTRAGDFSLVVEWVTTEEYTEPLDILRGMGASAGDRWADDLASIRSTPDKERGSFFSAARNALGATSDPAVLASCSAVELDIEQFLVSRSTLYIVSPTEEQDAVATLITALIESMVTTAYRMHREGRLPAHLRLLLDEVCNVTRFHGLESTISQGPQQGVTTTWATQSVAQFRSRYGVDMAEAIWSATRCKLIFAIDDGPTLDRLERLVGDERVVMTSKGVGSGSPRVTTSETWRPRVPASELRQIPEGWTLLLYHGRPPHMLRAPLFDHLRQLRGALAPWPAAPPAAAAGREAEVQPLPVSPEAAPAGALHAEEEG